MAEAYLEKQQSAYTRLCEIWGKPFNGGLAPFLDNKQGKVATIFDAFGLGKLANPIDAHIGYDTDNRVVALIAKGIGNKNTAKIVNDRCRWVETID